MFYSGSCNVISDHHIFITLHQWSGTFYFLSSSDRVV